MLTFLHLSDLHIGQDGPAAVDRDVDPREELIKDAERILGATGAVVTGVLISGDIAHSGEPDQYRRAGEWLDRLCAALKIPSENVWLVPGNHDFARDLRTPLWSNACKTLRECPIEEIDEHLRPYLGSKDREVLLAPLDPYHEFAEGYECVPEGPVQFWKVDFDLSEQVHLRIVGLNTAILSDGSEREDGLVIGENALQRWRKKDTFVLAMWHHPLELVRDGERASAYLNARAAVHLFGHEHSHRLSEEGSVLSVSAGALHPRRGEAGWDPRYNFITVEAAGKTVADGLKVSIMPRRWSPKLTSFAGEDGEVDPKTVDFRLGTRSEPDPGAELTPVPEPVNTSGESYEAEGERRQGRVANRRRRLKHLYGTLPLVKRVIIAAGLGLLEDGDRTLDGIGLTRLVIDRAADRGQLGELWGAVVGEWRLDAEPNPYEVVSS
jgi:Calcineurin-like phosphoesterase/GTPase-associated adaptor domain